MPVRQAPGLMFTGMATGEGTSGKSWLIQPKKLSGEAKNPVIIIAPRAPGKVHERNAPHFDTSNNSNQKTTTTFGSTFTTRESSPRSVNTPRSQLWYSSCPHARGRYAGSC